MVDTYAIFQTGGKQYYAIPGKTVAIEKLDGNVGDIVTFKEVLFCKKGDDAVEFGRPFVAKPALTASIVKHMRGPKIIVFRFKRRKKHRIKKGHRQPITVVRIETI